MTRFFMGLVLGILGFLVWAFGSVFWAIADATEGSTSPADPTPWIVIAAIGFTVMIGGPILFWVITPIVGLFRRKPASTGCPTCGQSIQPGQRFCGKCGGAVTMPPAVTAATDTELPTNG